MTSTRWPILNIIRCCIVKTSLCMCYIYIYIYILATISRTNLASQRHTNISLPEWLWKIHYNFCVVGRIFDLFRFATMQTAEKQANFIWSEENENYEITKNRLKKSFTFWHRVTRCMCASHNRYFFHNLFNFRITYTDWNVFLPRRLPLHKSISNSYAYHFNIVIPVRTDQSCHFPTTKHHNIHRVCQIDHRVIMR